MYLGVRSYSIYLWHWPVFALTRPGVDIHWGPVPVFILRVAITLVLADLSFRLVEAPIRSGAIGRWTACWRASEGEERSRRSRRAFLVGAVGVTSIVLLTGAIAGRAHDDRHRGSLRAGEEFVASQTTIGIGRRRSGQHGVAVGGGARHGGVRAGRGTLPPVETTTTVVLPPSPSSPSATRSCSARPPSCPRRSARARTSTPRSPPYTVAVDIVQALKDQGRLGQGVVLHLGNNGPMSAETFRAVMDQLVDVPRVVVVNVRDRPWEPDVNRVLAEQVPTYPNARLLDWWGESAMHGDWFADDKTHLNAAGPHVRAARRRGARGCRQAAIADDHRRHDRGHHHSPHADGRHDRPHRPPRRPGAHPEDDARPGPPTLARMSEPPESPSPGPPARSVTAFCSASRPGRCWVPTAGHPATLEITPR